MSELYKCISDYDYTTDDVVEENNGQDQCDISGYIDPSTYVSQMIEAGIALDQIRRGEYDYEGDDDDVDPEIDPLRAPWTDPADVDNFANGLAQTIENKKAAAQRAQANQQANAKASDHEQTYPIVDSPGSNDPESPSMTKVAPNGGQK